MKTIFAILALCLVATQAAPQVNYESVVDGIINQAEKIAKDTAVVLQRQVEEIVLDPLQQVEVAVQEIDDRKFENEACVIRHEPTVVATVDTLHSEMTSCGVVAAKQSAEIAVDVSDAVQQIVFEGYAVIQTYNKCRNYTNSLLKNACYARLSVQATVYAAKARKSIATIQESTSDRVPAVFAEGDICTHAASDKALVELNNVQVEIDNCIARLI